MKQMYHQMWHVALPVIRVAKFTLPLSLLRFVIQNEDMLDVGLYDDDD